MKRVLLLLAICGTVFAQQSKTIPVPPETAQEIRTALDSQERARLAYVAAQAQTEAIVNKAKAQTKCWPCDLQQDQQGQLVLVVKEEKKP